MTEVKDAAREVYDRVVDVLQDSGVSYGLNDLALSVSFGTIMTPQGIVSGWQILLTCRAITIGAKHGNMVLAPEANPKEDSLKMVVANVCEALRQSLVAEKMEANGNGQPQQIIDPRRQ